MSVYKVIGSHDYREHCPGSIFECRLDPAAEVRALARGNIVVIDSPPARLRPGSYRLPDGWQTQASDGAARAALLIEGRVA